MDTAFKAINDKGGIFGRKLSAIHLDDQYEPERAIVCFKELMSKNVFALCGLIGSPTAAKYIPMCMSNKVPAVGFYSGPIFIGEPVKRYIFNVRPSYRDEIRHEVDNLWNVTGARKFAVIYQGDAYGADCLEGVKSALASHHADILAIGSYTRNMTNVAEACQAVRQVNPDVVVLATVYNASAEVLKYAHDANWRTIFVMNTGTALEGLVKNAGKEAEGHPISEIVPIPSRTDLPVLVRYQKELQQYFPNEKPSFASLAGYLDALVFIEGLRRAGKDLTREKFVDALEKIHEWDIGLGKGMEINFSPTAHLGLRKVFFVVVKDGKEQAFDDWKGLGDKK